MCDFVPVDLSRGSVSGITGTRGMVAYILQVLLLYDSIQKSGHGIVVVGGHGGETEEPELTRDENRD